MLGKRIGKYVIEREIGRGGMGAVYAAVHETLGQQVAIKVLHPSYAQNAEAAGRFFNEALSASRIGHEAIVKVFDFGQLPDGTGYMMMELLRGESLRLRLLREERLPPQLALAITRQTASALVAAHAAGVVHRDIKPDNLFLVPDPETSSGVRVRVLDFGVAKVRLGALQGVDPESATASGALLGTPLYMAPEQCRGAGAVDGQADVYALGAIFFQMLTGRPPFQHKGHGALLMAHISEAPPELAKLRPDLPPPLCALIQRMLAKEPAARPTMKDLLQEHEGSVPRGRRRSAAAQRVAGAGPPHRPGAETRGAASARAQRGAHRRALCTQDPAPPCQGG